MVYTQDVGIRAKKLSKSVGKSYPWCKGFLEDFGEFSLVVARTFRLNHKVTDREIAWSIDAIRLREGSENDPDEDDLAAVFGPTIK